MKMEITDVQSFVFRCNYWTQMKKWGLSPYECGTIIMQLCTALCDHKEIQKTGDKLVDGLVEDMIATGIESQRRYVDKINAQPELLPILSPQDYQWDTNSFERESLAELKRKQIADYIINQTGDTFAEEAEKQLENI